ncbi:nitrogenase cofactor biosynthesis protein NifB [Sulfurivermis fontis]|uniref:nitrogenase cofactor biosynthesis protein NifB n=1 Tax=Sulfurivermis fontis TaxID=1972068 RepID=UPI000FD84759|nr:nitrogenase cofactor biosynthesis protein NifB [Sulfurivermis fontis]
MATTTPIEIGKQSGCSASSCGSTADQMSHLPAHIRERVFNHPCYSEQAHHHFARMHVAVAPACNIQCNYCNRKYDCANESRPGVVSEVLHPEQAVKKVLAVAAAIPQMTVVGIAGPGDPLANPERTFATFRGIAEYAPDIKLCVSTNGLSLPQHIDELSRHNIDHVTITINTLDEEIGAEIYPWVFWNHKRVRGRAAARILIEQQQRGLEMLTERGVLVKVNSVMIPGVNDAHLKEVSRVVKSKGAFLHNVMPLIAEPEHGTYYGIMEQRSPSAQELQALQDACAGDMNMMRHCRQCRADAVGLLGEDRGAEFTLDKIEAMEFDYEEIRARRAAVQASIAAEMNKPKVQVATVSLASLRRRAAAMPPVLMAVASNGGNVVNQHFGHATEFLVYEASANGVRFVGTRRTDQYCVGSDHCDEGEDTLARTISALEGCRAVLCARIGITPWEALEAAGIKPDSDHAMEPIEEAVAALYAAMAEAGELTAAPAAGASVA